MAGAQSDPKKWSLPGWRIEQAYSNKTLIGNWNEERHKFGRGTHSSDTTHHLDFKLFPDHKPDFIIRREGLLRNGGLEKQHIFSHHGKRYKNNLISWYDEQYNHRKRLEGDQLPDLRRWDGHTLSWAPERTDYPMQGPATNFGLHPRMKEDWIKQVRALRQGSYVSENKQSYTRHPDSAFPHRYASAPKHLSSHFNPISKVNKDLWLRRTPFNMAPEYPPNVNLPSVV